ncbi:phospho-N-acetylmuramoyl-pentapeptide-transferase [Candidatus Microgenomates bacterium]|nr:phospho-N-acetylmuramoyl-pentapeptide-transferase [Candidatus Microgenomates bacterium]
MTQALGLAILSFFLTSLLIVPFINFLYRLKFRRQRQKTTDIFKKPTPVFDRFHSWKAGTPVGGGILIIIITTLLTVWAYAVLGVAVKPWELFVLLFGMLSFGLLGLYDDAKKIDWKKNGVSGLSFRTKFILQWILALIIAVVFYTQLGFDFIYIHFIGALPIGPFFIPLAAFVIVSFTNAFNITDGLDGLSSGLFLICLASFWIITQAGGGAQLDQGLAIFIAILIGSVIAFLYFNIFPARIWLGDAGALALGATLGIVGLLTGRMIVLAVIGGVFVVEVASSMIQLASKKFLGFKILPVSPLHLYLQSKGWEEPKIVMRFWITGFLLAIIGLFLATAS